MSQLELLYAKGKNFMSYKEIYFDLCQGMSLIEGWNHDENSSNGSGKSSLLDLLSYGLFDEVPRDLKIDEVINEAEGKECETEIGFKLNNSVYQIVKKRKPNDAYIIRDGIELPRGKDLKETREQIQRLIRFDYKTFVNSIYLTQGGKSEFIALSDSDKQKILTEVLDLSIFDDAYKSASQTMKDFDTQYSLTQSQIGQHQSRAIEINGEMAQLSIKSNSFDKDRAAVIKSRELEQENIRQQNVQLELEVARLSGFVDANIPSLDVLAERSQIEALNEKLKLQSQVDQIVTQASQNIYSLNNEIKRLEVELGQINQVGEGKCSRCKQTVNGTHLEEEKTLVKNKMSSVIAEKAGHEQQYAQYKQVQDKFKELTQQRQTLEQQIHQKQIQHQSSINANEQARLQVKFQIDSLNNRIKANNDNYHRLTNEIVQYSQMKNDYEGMLKEKQVKFDEQEQMVIQLQGRLVEFETLSRKFNVLKEMYKNIKYYIFANMTQTLNDNIKTYLDTLFNCSIQVELNTETTNTKGDIKQKFQTEIYKNGVKRSYNSLSGGEKQRVKLATSFAFAEVLSSRSTNSLNILFLDEILGEGLDSEGAARVVDLLEKIKQTKNIFIIDHHEYVKVLVDKIIRVEKRNDISQLVS